MSFELTTSQIQFSSFKLPNNSDFKSLLILWASKFEVFCYLDTNEVKDKYGKYDFILGVDAINEINHIDDIQVNKFQFGYIKYSVKDCFYFEPRYIIYGKENRIYINRNAIESMMIIDEIQSIKLDDYTIPSINFKPKTDKNSYHSNIDKIQSEIRNGRFYELNYCIEFEALNSELNPIYTFIQINQKAKAPMSALVKNRAEWLLSFSPERLVAKRELKLIAQPIKGTARRNLVNLEQDESIKFDLKHSQKEIAENMMIVDLMRHDLTPYSEIGTIKVTELCEIYTFPFVHQMISTIESKLKDSLHSILALKNLLPAGSMTGAPKIEVMKAIAELENFDRGYYAGNIGYIDADGDMDFNVIIRTIIYNEKNKNSKLNVGGAITLLSDADKEFEECLLKAEGILKNFK